MPNLKPGRIGIDLDNTLIDYSDAARYLAWEENIADVASLSELRALYRESDNQKWQYFQARLYTDGLEYATPAIDSMAFMAEARELGAQLSIVSHKTLATPAKFGARDLRKPALDWLRRVKIIPEFITEDQVFFCTSQKDKIKKVSDLKLDWFIDDLREVLDNPDFPAHTVRWLYAPGSEGGTGDNWGNPEDPISHRVVSGFSDLLQRLKADARGA